MAKSSERSALPASQWSGLPADELHEEGLPTPDDLMAWGVPSPSAAMADRITAAVTRDTATTDAHHEPNPRWSNTSAPENIQELRPKEPAVNPTVLSRNSLSISVAVGFAIAAAVLLAFWVGRASVEAPPAVTVAPPAVAQPGPPAAIVPHTHPVARPAPAVPVPVVEGPMSAEPPEVPEPPARREGREVGGTTPDLANPLNSLLPKRRRRTRRSQSKGNISGDLQNPFGKSDSTAQPSADFKDPFRTGEAKKTARLRIGTTAGMASAEVEVDGVAVGHTPIMQIWVTPGRHKVVFTWPDGRTVTKFVNVEANATAKIRGG